MQTERPARAAAGPPAAIEPGLSAPGAAHAGEVAEAGVRGSRPVVVVTVAGIGAGRRRHRRETNVPGDGPREPPAAGKRPLVVTAGTVAERVPAVIIEGELVEAVAQVGAQQGRLPTPAADPLPRQPQPRGAFIARVGVAAQREVAPETLADMAVHRDPAQQGGPSAAEQRAARGETRLPQPVPSRGRLEQPGPEGRGRGGHHAHQTARRIRPEGPGLRTAQHLDLLHIEGRGRAAEAGEVEVVDEETHRRIGRFALVLGILADAADLEMARPRRATRPGEVRDLVDEIAEVADSAAQRARLVQTHARRHTLGRRFPEVGRHAQGRELDRRAGRHGLGKEQGRRQESGGRECVAETE